jgi:hypothetical protein
MSFFSIEQFNIQVLSNGFWKVKLNQKEFLLDPHHVMADALQAYAQRLYYGYEWEPEESFMQDPNFPLFFKLLSPGDLNEPDESKRRQRFIDLFYQVFGAHVLL